LASSDLPCNLKDCTDLKQLVKLFISFPNRDWERKKAEYKYGSPFSTSLIEELPFFSNLGLRPYQGISNYFLNCVAVEYFFSHMRKLMAKKKEKISSGGAE
jgi:hypothetical protein